MSELLNDWLGQKKKEKKKVAGPSLLSSLLGVICLTYKKKKKKKRKALHAVTQEHEQNKLVKDQWGPTGSEGDGNGGNP